MPADEGPSSETIRMKSKRRLLTFRTRPFRCQGSIRPSCRELNSACRILARSPAVPWTSSRVRP